jgi:hypothetical protein
MLLSTTHTGSLASQKTALEVENCLVTTLWLWSIGTMSPVTIKDHSFANSGSPYLN